MSFIFTDNDQVSIELKKLMLEAKTTQREIAESLDMKPQGLAKLLSKKNFGFEDVQKVLAIMGYSLVIDFQKKTE